MSRIQVPFRNRTNPDSCNTSYYFLITFSTSVKIDAYSYQIKQSQRTFTMLKGILLCKWVFVSISVQQLSFQYQINIRSSSVKQLKVLNGQNLSKFGAGHATLE